MTRGPRCTPRAAIVLAAGQSRRMGHPKALLPFEGRSLVERHVARFAAFACDPVLVVVRPALVEQLRGLSSPPTRILAVETSSQGASLAEAARVLVASATGERSVLVTPVDLLAPGEEVLHALLEAIDAGAHAATPTFRSRGGHPIALRDASVAQLAEGRETPLRDHLTSLGARRVRVPVDDPRILGDLDHPRDLLALASG